MQTTQTLLSGGGGALLVAWGLVAFSVRMQDVVVRSINSSMRDVIPPFRNSPPARRTLGILRSRQDPTAAAATAAAAHKDTSCL